MATLGGLAGHGHWSLELPATGVADLGLIGRLAATA
jgi:hypothetical protein